MAVRIYQPAKTAMQSGQRNMRGWVLEFEPRSRRTIDDLMGWTSSADTPQQLRLSFPTEDAAVDFARRNGLDYHVARPQRRRPKQKSYAHNFRFDRVE